MPPESNDKSGLNVAGRAVVEIAFIVFLFYSNLLMGEFTRSSRGSKTLLEGIADVVTYQNFGIALVTACIGFVVFEWLRKKV